MYSAVLMLAVMAGNDSVDFGGRNRGCSTASKACTASKTCARSGGHGLGLFKHGCTTTARPVATGCAKSGHGCAKSGHGLFSGGLFKRGCCGTTAPKAACTTAAPAKKDMPKGEPVPDPKPKKTVSAPATIIVNLPANARLIVDGNQTTSTAEIRTLVTPNLDFGTTYAYTMRAEIVRDGITVEETQIVNVVGGQTSNVRFNFTQTVASR